MIPLASVRLCCILTVLRFPRTDSSVPQYSHVRSGDAVDAVTLVQHSLSPEHQAWKRFLHADALAKETWPFSSSMGRVLGWGNAQKAKEAGRSSVDDAAATPTRSGLRIVDWALGLIAPAAPAAPAAAASSSNSSSAQRSPQRVVFSLTSTQRRIDLIEPVLNSIIRHQKRRPDVVNLAIPPQVVLPSWLLQYNSSQSVIYDASRPLVFNILRMKEDYGPASKLLATLREGGEHSEDTIIVYGDDDVIYGSEVVQMHVESQMEADMPTAFGSRLINLGSDFNKSRVGEELSRHGLLEATGSISVRASWLPEAAFSVARTPDICRLSDDFWLAHHLLNRSINFALLPRCQYNFTSLTWPESCGLMRTVPAVEKQGALSAAVLDTKDPLKNPAVREGGNWKSQFVRYQLCGTYLSLMPASSFSKLSPISPFEGAHPQPEPQPLVH